MNLIAGDIDPAQSVNWLLPLSELIYGGIASHHFALIYKLEACCKKGMADYTAKIQAELDGAAEALESLAPKPKRSSCFAGDIASEVPVSSPSR